MIYTPLALAFLAYLFWRDHERLVANLSEVAPGLVGVIFLLVALGHLCIGLSSHLLLRSLDHKPGLGLVLSIHINRLPARYLPGGIWQTVTRALDFSAKGLPKATILRLVLLEMGISVCLAAVIGGAVLLWMSGNGTAPVFGLVALIGAVGLIVGPRLTGMLGKDVTSMSGATYLASVGSFSLVWVLYGSAFALFAAQMVPGIDWARAIGIYLISWLAGFLAFFAPQGIGVFEVTSSYLLTGTLASGLVTSMFAFRALTIVADLCVWLIFRVWRWLTCTRSGDTDQPQPSKGNQCNEKI
ncbi:hypothetical protein [uncultured Thiodictyon sp.]|uniref:hypothetical protein n=1 Tax=uncultured Thiodictyon sp. TaxID=1846217 RepID=UPI0025E09BF9|nr:hypothetical protein [uncultured Thiodictyon sp.]